MFEQLLRRRRKRQWWERLLDITPAQRLVPRRRRARLPNSLWWAAVVAAGAVLVYALTRRSIAQSVARLVKPPAEPLDLTKPHAIRVEKSVTISKSPDEIYQFWRQLETLPRFMKHLEAVNVTDERHSHWIAKAPAGMKVQWDAEIVNDLENEFISWRSLENADVPNAGSVAFRPLEDGEGTEVSVVLEYDPPAGVLGAAFARLFGEEPSVQVADDLKRLKQLLETGELPANDGQSEGPLDLGNVPDFLKNIVNRSTEGEE